MTIDGTTSLIELATIVSEQLDQAGMSAVLSGGSAVSIHTSNRSRSKDLDFVTNERIEVILDALAPLGFQRGSDHRHLVHPDAEWFVEFPAGPVQVGNAIITDWMQMKTPHGILQILSPTQSVMDRLAAYFHYDDPQSLEQAVIITEVNAIDWGDLDGWAMGEDSMEKYQRFRSMARQ